MFSSILPPHQKFFKRRGVKKDYSFGIRVHDFLVLLTTSREERKMKWVNSFLGFPSPFRLLKTFLVATTILGFSTMYLIIIAGLWLVPSLLSFPLFLFGKIFVSVILGIAVLLLFCVADEIWDRAFWYTNQTIYCLRPKKVN